MTGEDHVTQIETSCFDLVSYLKEKKQLVEAALDASIPITCPEKIYDLLLKCWNFDQKNANIIPN